MKKNLTWKQLLLLFLACEIVAHIIPVPFSYTSYPVFEIGRALAASFEIGALLAFVLGLFEGVKTLSKRNK